jgi:hypothetical protein
VHVFFYGKFLEILDHFLCQWVLPVWHVLPVAEIMNGFISILSNVFPILGSVIVGQHDGWPMSRTKFAAAAPRYSQILDFTNVPLMVSPMERMRAYR